MVREQVVEARGIRQMHGVFFFDGLTPNPSRITSTTGCNVDGAEESFVAASDIHSLAVRCSVRHLISRRAEAHPARRLRAHRRWKA